MGAGTVLDGVLAAKTVRTHRASRDIAGKFRKFADSDANVTSIVTVAHINP